MQMENKKRMPQQAPQAKADKAPAEQDTALVWGKNPVTELLKSEAGVDTLLLADSMEPRMAGYYTALGKAAGAVIKRVPAGKLQKLCGTQDHQGVAAWAARIQYVGVEELLQIAKDRGEPPFLVLCDGIEDPHNLGAILRSALLCGAHGVIIPRRGGVGVTGTVMKSSAGAAARIPVARVANLPQAIRDLKSRTFLFTVPTWAVLRWKRPIFPARWRWCWAARAQAPAHWCANCAMPPLRWIWPVAKPVWTVITSAWPPVF